MVTADETVKMFSRIFMIPAAQVCTGGDVFEPKRRSEDLFADAARIEAVDKDCGLFGVGPVCVNALYGKHVCLSPMDSGRLNVQTT